MTPQELIAEIERFEQRRRDLAALLSAAYDESLRDDADSLLLDEAERIISGLPGAIDEARLKVLTYLGACTLAEKAEVGAS
jgi:ATP-dependent exoDNAse (exonuclease V) alpha subunit